jgi:hypothetical protein
MIWTLRISFILFLAWIVFMVSPFVALYDLSKAVEAPRNDEGGRAGAAATPVNFGIGSIEQAWRLFISSETQGFRSITIPLPPLEIREKQFRVTLRLSGITWRLTGLELPQALRRQLARRADRKTD